MNELSPRIVSEQRVAEKMIRLYCKKNHGGEELCASCESLRHESVVRLSACPYSDHKPTCRNCTTHCWSGDARESIKTVMRYSGPRMILHDPVSAAVHMIHSFRVMKFAAVTLGWISLILGVIGVVLPGLPTTPFVLLSAFLFSQSSPKFHRWIRRHKFFGELITSWETSRSLPKKLKMKALLLFTATITISVIFIPVVHAKILVSIMGAVGLVFLLRVPVK